MTSTIGRTESQSQVTDSVKQQVKKYEEQCREFNAFKQRALNDIGIRIGRLDQHAADIDAMLPLTSDGQTGEASQIRQRVNEATKTIIQSSKYCVTNETTIRLRVEHKPVLSLRQNSSQAPLAIQTQDTAGTIQKVKKAPQLQTTHSRSENQEGSGNLRMPLRSPTVDSVKGINAPGRNKGKALPSGAKHPRPNANKKRRRVEAKTVRMRDVHDAFIFEFPHNTSLLWILRCSPCKFQAKRNPLIATSNVMSHWNSKHQHGTTFQEILENHLVQVIDGSIDEAMKMNIEIGATGKTECQPRRAKAPRYLVPEFIKPLLSCNKRRKLAGSSARNELADRQSDTRPNPAIQELRAANEVATPLPQRQSQTLTRPVYESSTKPSVGGEFASLLRKRPLPSPSLALPSPSRRSGNPDTPTLVLRSNSPPSKAVETSRVGGAWIDRSVMSQTRGPTPAYENGRDTAEYAGFNTGYRSTYRPAH